MSFLYALIVLSNLAVVAGEFNDHFQDKTMRLDYYHTGTATEEHIAIDRIVSDGPWPGSKKNLIDRLNFGKYLLEVKHETSNQVLFSYGFATIYGEWETTRPAKEGWGVFHESLRFPWPKHKVVVVLNKRDDNNHFQPIWEQTIDPSARHINPTDLTSPYPVFTIQNNGPAEHKVDLVILGDGYTANQMEKFHTDSKRVVDALFQEEPYKSRRSDFNVYTVDVPSAQTGVSRPHENVYRRSALNSHYSAFDSQRYVLNYDNRRLRDIASAVPYEYMVIMVNEQAYGGGGIFRWQATAAADNSQADYLFVHEFGHHFAGLADEYYTSSIAYELNQQITVEPWEANITALLDPQNLKWKDLMEEGTPLPTPWKKEIFEKHSRETQKKRQQLRQAQAPEAELEALFAKQATFETELLGTMKYSGKTGAFEGAGYMQKGLYRSSADCLMFTRDKVGFCPACSRAIDQVIDYYTK